MKIQVISEGGERREIELIGEVMVYDRTENPQSTLNEIRCNGMDYFFTKDGFFDGWGSGSRAILDALPSPPSAAALSILNPKHATDCPACSPEVHGHDVDGNCLAAPSASQAEGGQGENVLGWMEDNMEADVFVADQALGFSIHTTRIALSKYAASQTAALKDEYARRIEHDKGVDKFRLEYIAELESKLAAHPVSSPEKGQK